MTAGQLVRQARRDAGLTQAQLAARLSISQAAVAQLESARANPTLATLERALGAAGDATGPLVDGVRLTLASLSKKVAELGAERIPVVGQPFDPRLAEAVDLVAVGDPSQDDVVVQEVRAGYRIGERVLRPARVRVGRLARA
jgi:molecular chaperone GrpE